MRKVFLIALMNTVTFEADALQLRTPLINPSKLIYRLYFRNGPKNGAILLHPQNATDSTQQFDTFKPAKIITHGWETDANESWIWNMTQAFLAMEDCNVISFDWSTYADSRSYALVTVAITPVGQALGDFIWKTFGNTLSGVHVIGHSLGAHVAGAAGEQVKRYGNKLPRITGLDAAAPLFRCVPRWHKLTKDDAVHVDAIHTDAGLAGKRESYGTADYFPNGGGPIQPGCSTVECSHQRSHELYTESILSNRFVCVPCDSYSSFEAGLCSNNSRTVMGNDEPQTNSGNYYLNTNGKPPFALGDGFPAQRS